MRPRCERGEERFSCYVVFYSMLKSVPEPKRVLQPRLQSAALITDSHHAKDYRSTVPITLLSSRTGVLRLIAPVVFCTHRMDLAPMTPSDTHGDLTSALGIFGVQVFFLLSAFLITNC